LNILAIIPARSGSKSVIDKNIRDMNGKPMLAWSVEHALKSSRINRVILSTDSEKYAEIGRLYGAETPFIRPAEYATDTALDLDVFKHALNWLKENEGYEVDIVVQLRPTYPKRNIEDIDRMIDMLIDDPEADSVRSVSKAGEVPHKMWLRTENSREWCEDEIGVMEPLIKDIPECYNMPRQELPKAYYQNACIDVMRAATVLEKNSMTGDKILGYYMDENLDIDTETELLKAEIELLKEKLANKNVIEGLLKGKKRLVFDIDGVIAKLQPKNDYALSEPATDMISAINRLYDAGNYIVLNTARGYVTGIDWSETTKKQLEKWGLKYHELHFGKPNADYYIDDKSLDMEVIRSISTL